MTNYFNKTNLYIHFVLIIAMLAIALHFIPLNSVEKKVAYVKSQDLIYGYLGTKEIQNKFNLQVQLYYGQLDSLKSDYKVSLTQLNQEFSGLSVTEKASRQELIAHQENNIRKYQLDIEEKIKTEEAELMTGVFNQINAFVEEYAEENQLSMVFGTTTQGNILFGEEAMDITEDLLNQLNAQY